MEYETIQADVLIIGGGGAGARAAIEADEQGVSVALVNKGLISRSGLTPMAGGSLQAAFGYADPQDSPRAHFEDTIREGRFLGDENLVRVLTEEALDRVRDLERYGVKFLKQDGKLAQFRTPGVTHPRFIRIPGRGAHLMRGLKDELARRPGIRVFEDVIVSKILGREGRPAGAVAFLQREGRFQVFQAKALVLATGGYEELWGRTIAAPDSTGDGIALADQLGAELVDLEMMLYIPTVTLGSPLYPSMPMLLMYEFLLDPEHLGGKLVNARGEEFLPPGELPVRDLLTRLIVREQVEGRATPRGGVFVDLSRSSLTPEEMERRIEERGFRNQFSRFASIGIDLKRTPMEVSPACLYSLGGVRINERTETSVPGLFAAGEAAGNVHGANRLSGNAISEIQVFGQRAGAYAGQEARAMKKFPPLDPAELGEEMERVDELRARKKEPLRPIELRRRIKGLMDGQVGVIRDGTGLRKAIDSLRRMAEEDLPRLQAVPLRKFNLELQDAIEVGFMVRVAELVARSALRREESRGHHFRSDFPREEKNWLCHTLMKKEGDKLSCGTAPVIRLAAEWGKSFSGPPAGS